MSKFKMDLVRAGSVAKITMSGVIDESIDFSSDSFSDCNSLELHLREIKTINSTGIRDWIKWLSQFKEKKISLHECPSCIMDQINMIRGFIPSTAKVMSFYVPYYGDETDTTKDVLFIYGTNYTDDEILLLPKVLDEAGNPMEMDVIEGKYFKFLKKL